MVALFYSRVVRGERANGNRESFAGLVLIFSDEPMTTVKRTVLLSYPFHSIPLNLSLKKTQLMKDNAHTLI